MRPARRLCPAGLPLAIALARPCCRSLGGAARRAGERADSSFSRRRQPPGGSDEGGAKKKARKPSGKSNGADSPKSKASPDTKTAHAQASTHLARQKPARRVGLTSSTRDVTLTPFPSHADAAKKALAQNRRDQLDDAEKAARGPDQAERWQTVLFHLRDLDARSDSEGCFWRLVSYYRLGQIERARSLRQACELGAQGRRRSSRPRTSRRRACRPPTALADKDPAPVANLAPYAGDGPAKVDR